MSFLAQVQKKYKITSADMSGTFLKSLHDYIMGDDAPPTAKDKGAKTNVI